MGETWSGEYKSCKGKVTNLFEFLVSKLVTKLVNKYLE